MVDDESNTKEEYNLREVPKVWREEVDFSYVMTQTILAILNASRNDLTNDVKQLNTMTNALDYLGIFVTPLADELFFKDMEIADNTKDQEVKNKIVWTTIINQLARSKLLFKTSRPVYM